jgi:hypothetical protein
MVQWMNSLTISSNAIIEKVDIFSLTGMLVLQNVSNQKIIKVSQLNKGSYVVKVTTANDILKQMIIKE